MRHRNDNMLLRIAQGDAYCMASEYCERHPDELEYAELREIKRYLAHPTFAQVKPGCYTDDAQMSIAVAEYLIDGQRGCVLFPESLTHAGFMQCWFDVFKRDPRYGYSQALQELLTASNTVDEFKTQVRPNSNKNGAAMRSVPLGVIRNVGDLVQVAGLQASTTHATYGGINSSIAVALMSHFALYDRRPFISMRGWGNQHCPAFEHFREPHVGPVDGSNDKRKLGMGLLTAHAVHTLLVEQTSLMGIMRQVIEWGGDTDSVCAIAWGIASSRYPDEVIPEFLERDLETGGKYGPTYLKELGRQLMEAYA